MTQKNAQQWSEAGRASLVTGRAKQGRNGEDSDQSGDAQGRNRRRRRRSRRRPNNDREQPESANNNQSSGRRRRGRGGASGQEEASNRSNHSNQNNNNARHRNRSNANNRNNSRDDRGHHNGGNQGGDNNQRRRYQRAKDAVPLTPFEVFCAYHLGIVENNGYKRFKAREVARRFDVSLQEFQEAMRRFGLERSSLNGCGFDLEIAQLDIRVAPDGIDRRELAKVLFEELVELNEATRTHHEAALKAEEEARKLELARKLEEEEEEDEFFDDDEEE